MSADAAGWVAEWLRAAPGVQMLVTSRGWLDLREEVVFTVPPSRVSAIDTSSCAFVHENGRSNTPLITLKIAAVTPTPSAISTMDANAKPGCRMSTRTP